MNNVVDTYTDFILEQFSFYAKKIMEKHYVASIFNTFAKEYISVRYYNIYPQKQDIKSTVNYYLNQKLKQLKEENPEKLKTIDFMTEIFNYIIYLDNDIEADAVNKVEKELMDIRKKYNLEEKIEFSKEYREFRKTKKEFIKNYETTDFFIETKKIDKNLFDTILKHDIKMPELYSDKAIESVYNSGLISEDKLFVKYNLVAIQILEEIIKYDYKTSYLVDFNIDLFKKKDKLNRLMKIIDNDITKEKIALKITYTNLSEKREEIFELINEGYNFALIKDDNYKEDNYISLFKYVLDSEV